MTPNVSKKPRIPWLIRVAFWLSAPAVQPRTPQDATDVDLLREQLEAAQQTLIEIAQEGYERVLQKRYEETLEQLEASQAALAAFFAEWDGDVGTYAPTDDTEALMRAALYPAKEPA